jgi:type III pantothenate kinase
MILSLDVGNTTIHGGLFKDEKLVFQFRRTSDVRASSDELGVFLRNVIRENGADPAEVKDIAICSVVPDSTHSIRSACQKYFGLSPFLLQAGVKTGLKVKYGNALEVGADRIADAIAAIQLYPNRNLIIVDFGTATTIEVVNRDKEYLGGVILAGMRIAMEALESRTAKLPTVEIARMGSNQVLGKSTVESIQSGLYFGTLGQVREFVSRFSKECFDAAEQDHRPPMVIGTGGFAGLFESEGIFDAIHPDLVLQGLNHAFKLNQ